MWGTLFFIFMNFAALSTIIAVFENIVSFSIDLFQWSRKKSVILNFIIIVIGSIPCAIGFSILSGFQPLGAGSAVLDLLDFLVSIQKLTLVHYQHQPQMTYMLEK